MPFHIYIVSTLNTFLAIDKSFDFQEKKNDSGASSIPEQKSVMVTVDGKPKHPGGKKPPKVVPTSNMVCC